MNVYDFDGTIYEGDSTRDFWKFSVKRHPACLKTLPVSLFWGAGYGLKLVDRDKFKSHFYPFLALIPDIDEEIKIFWETHEKNIMTWYREAQRPDDLIMSASPQFLLDPVSEMLGVRIIASPVDKHTGKLLGPNNHGERKCRRFDEAYPGNSIDNFYSDAHTDDPLAKRAKQAFLTRHGKQKPWKF